MLILAEADATVRGCVDAGSDGARFAGSQPHFTPSLAMPRSPRFLRLLFPAVLLAACSSGDEGVSVSGDIEGLDTLGFRGDSLIAQANRPLTLESLQLESARRDSAAPSDSTGRTATTRDSRAGSLAVATAAAIGVNPMTLRAQARGDSMARAEAQRLVGNRTNGGRSGGDTARGVVTLTGNEPARQAALKSGDALIALSGMATRGLARLEGLEVTIRGIKVTPRDLVVSDYIVRSAAGVPAFDGRLEEAGGGWTLRLTDGSGRKRITSLPAPLRGLSGARVWIAMLEGGAPTAYGLVGDR